MRANLAEIGPHFPGKYPYGSGRKSQATAKAIDNVPWDDSKHKQQFSSAEKVAVERAVYYQDDGKINYRGCRKQRMPCPGHKQADG